MRRDFVRVLLVGAALTAAVTAAPSPARTGVPPTDPTGVPPTNPSSATPRVTLMVVGSKRILLGARRVAPAARTLRVGGRRCTAPAGTPLAALLAAHLPLGVTDASGCDPAALFVNRIRRDANHGRAGWEYKVGNRAPSFGAGDPGGRLHAGQQLLWFWCVNAAGCQRTLALTVSFAATKLLAHVTGYDDAGHGRPVAGATVHVGRSTATTDARGSVKVPLSPGRYTVYASKRGLVRSFPTEVAATP